MFGPPGRAYVYLVYGMYDCLNVVTEPAGAPAALLVRAVEPVEGVDRMRLARILRTTTRRPSLTAERAAAEAARITGLASERVASGPGLVAAAFGIGTDWTGLDLCDPASPLRLEIPQSSEPPPDVATTPRVGIDYAGAPWTDRRWRFIERGNRSVSGPAATR
jgi:DNA-3-methyladenine glycosylase